MSKFNVVVDFDYVKEDFIIAGLFTKPEDAKEFSDAINSERGDRQHKVTNIGEQSLEWVKDMLVKERLGDLKAVLERLEAKL